MPENEPNAPTPEQIKDLLQQAILRNYPNPERRGCPGLEALSTLAQRNLPHEGTHWQHVSHCSPCYREFLEIRGEVLELRRARRRTRTMGWAVVSCAVAMVAIFFLFLRPGEQGHQAPEVTRQTPVPRPEKDGTPRTLTAVLNFEGGSASRGSETGEATADLQRIPRTPIDLAIYLPLGSEPGQYEVSLLHNRTDREPLASFKGTAELRDGLTVLKIKPNLSQFPAGTYTFAFRRKGESWRYRRVVLS